MKPRRGGILRCLPVLQIHSSLLATRICAATEVGGIALIYACGVDAGNSHSKLFCHSHGGAHGLAAVPANRKG